MFIREVSEDLWRTKDLFTPNDSVTVTVTLTGKTGTQLILPITVPIKNIKGAARQRYGDGDGIALCEWALTERKLAVLAQQR